MDRSQLVEQAQQGDHEAFAVLVRMSVPRLDAAARLILRDPEWAKDAVQDAYLRAWRDLRGLRDADRFDGWLHRLLANACHDQLRRRRGRHFEVELTEREHPPSPDAFAATLVRDDLDRGFQHLKPEQRAVIVLHYYLGLPLGEVAATMGVPLGTAKSRLHRALRAMRIALDDDAAGGEPAVGGQ